MATIDPKKVNERTRKFSPPEMVALCSGTNNPRECFVRQRFCEDIQMLLIDYAIRTRSVVPTSQSSEP